jgi:hypothetical protein
MALFVLTVIALTPALAGSAAETDSRKAEPNSIVQSAQQVSAKYYVTCFQAGNEILGQGLSGYPKIAGVKSSGKLHIRGQTKDGRDYEIWVSTDTTCRVGQK